MGAGLLRSKGMRSNQLFRIEFDMLVREPYQHFYFENSIKMLRNQDLHQKFTYVPRESIWPLFIAGSHSSSKNHKVPWPQEDFIVVVASLKVGATRTRDFDF
jgi:hypothetical protein